MRKIKRACVVLIFAVLFCSGRVHVEAAEKSGMESAETYTEDFLNILDMSELEDYLNGQEQTCDISFMELVTGLIKGEIALDEKEMLSTICNLLWGEISTNKGILVTVLLLAISCAFVKNFADIFRNTFVSDVCFLMIYMELTALLLKSFLLMNEIVTDTIEQIVEFMSMLVPVFCMSLSFSMANITAAGFYQLAFLVVYIVQWVILAFLLPVVQILMIAEMMNYMVPGEKFTRLCELLEGVVRWCLKFMVTAVFGINVVQGIMAPAIDRLKMSGVTKTISVIPGVGNAVNALTEMMLGAGMVIKSSVGTAGIVILVILFLIPFAKMLMMSLLYKMAAAVSEPIADKRISGSINSVSKGCVLLQKVMLTALVLFLVTIAMITAASSFGMG